MIDPTTTTKDQLDSIVAALNNGSLNMGDMTPTGFRKIGERKLKLIKQADAIIASLSNKGVKIMPLKKLLGIEGTPHQITTKKWTAVIGQLKQFQKENGLAPEYELSAPNRKGWGKNYFENSL